MIQPETGKNAVGYRRRVNRVTLAQQEEITAATLDLLKSVGMDRIEHFPVQRRETGGKYGQS